jgi:hypothetical protein
MKNEEVMAKILRTSKFKGYIVTEDDRMLAFCHSIKIRFNAMEKQ